MAVSPHYKDMYGSKVRECMEILGITDPGVTGKLKGFHTYYILRHRPEYPAWQMALIMMSKESLNFMAKHITK